MTKANQVTQMDSAVPTRAALLITIEVMRRYLRELTAVADAMKDGGFGEVLATTVRMYTSAATEESEGAIVCTDAANFRQV